MTAKKRWKNYLPTFTSDLNLQARRLLLKIKARLGRRSLIILLVLLLGVAVLRIITARKPDWTLDTTKVKRGELTESISASGEIAAEEVANLTFQTGGLLAWVGVKEGDEVRAWQAIASLDKKQLELELTKILNAWQREFTEFDDTNYSVRDEVLTEAVRRIKRRAQIDLDQTQLDVEIQNEAIRLATIVAPFSGLVTKAEPAYPGINVTPATASYTIINPETVYFEAEVNEIDVTKLFVGQEVLVELDAYPDEQFEGKIKSVDFASTLTSTGGTAYKVKVSLPRNDERMFRLGMNGNAEFIVSISSQVLMIPQTAIVEEKAKTFVWIVDKGSKTKKVEVRVGISSIDNLEIISGLNEGDEVILRPPTEIREGDRIKSS